MLFPPQTQRRYLNPFWAPGQNPVVSDRQCSVMYVQQKSAGRTKNDYPGATGWPLLPALNGIERVPPGWEPEGKVASLCPDSGCNFYIYLAG
jgi:hypothetical protein